MVKSSTVIPRITTLKILHLRRQVILVNYMFFIIIICLFIYREHTNHIKKFIKHLSLKEIMIMELDFLYLEIKLRISSKYRNYAIVMHLREEDIDTR